MKKKCFIAFCFFLVVFNQSIINAQIYTRSSAKPINDKVFEKSGTSNRYDKSYALIIANSDYDYFPKLDSIPKDAITLKDSLLNVVGFDKVEVAFNLKTKTEILNKLDSFLIYNYYSNERLRLFIFLMGHGLVVLDRTNPKMGYFIATQTKDFENDSEYELYENWTTKKEDLNSYIRRKSEFKISSVSYDEIISKAKQSKGHHTLIIIDGCYAGSLGESKEVTRYDGQNKISDLIAASSFRAVEFITSGTDNQQVPADSKFFDSFLQAICGNIPDVNKNGDEGIQTSELIEFLAPDINNKANNIPQLFYLNDGNNRGEMFFVTKSMWDTTANGTPWGKVLVETNPPGAKISIKDKNGKTHFTKRGEGYESNTWITELKVDTKYRMEITKEHYGTEIEDFSLLDEMPVYKFFPLKDSYLITFIGNPKDAEIWDKDKYLGKASQPIPFEPYENAIITIKKDNYINDTVHISVTKEYDTVNFERLKSMKISQLGDEITNIHEPYMYGGIAGCAVLGISGWVFSKISENNFDDYQTATTDATFVGERMEINRKISNGFYIAGAACLGFSLYQLGQIIMKTHTINKFKEIKAEQKKASASIVPAPGGAQLSLVINF